MQQTTKYVGLDVHQATTVATRALRVSVQIQSPVSPSIKGPRIGPTVQSSSRVRSTARTHSIATAGPTAGPTRRSYMPGAVPSSCCSTGWSNSR
jgi:hypothetical protein